MLLQGHGPRRGQTPIGAPFRTTWGFVLFPSSRLVIPPRLEGTALRRHHQHQHTTRAKPSCHTASSRDGVPGRERCGVKLGGPQLGHGAAAGLLHPLDSPKATHRSRFIKDPFPQSDAPTLPTALRVRSGFQLFQTLENTLLRTPTSSPSQQSIPTHRLGGGSGLTPLPLPHPQLLSPNTHPSSSCPRAPLHHRHIRVPPLLLQRSWEDQVRLPAVT